MRVALLGTTVACVLGFRSGLIRALVQRGNVVYAFASDYTENSKHEVALLGAIPIEYKINRSGLNPFSDLICTLKLIKQFKDLKLDLVFSYFVKPVIFGSFASKLAGVPKSIGMLEGLGYVFTDKENGSSAKEIFLKKVQLFLYHMSIPLLDSLIFLNHDDPVDLIVNNNIKAKSVHVLGGIGVDLKKFEFSPVNIDAISFLFVGRLLNEKGINEFIDAAKIVKKIHPEVKFVVLGGLDSDNPGSLSKESLDQLIQDDLIVYSGYVKDVKPWLINSSVFVLPSYREGVPLSTQEAMAIGRAVITTNVPGCRETVIDGKNGFLIPPWSSQVLAEKMIFLIDNPNRIKEMGEESAKIALEKFDEKIVNTKLLELLGISKEG
nr:glycosyltransferase family 4 protein [uncultured Deefgea sp.]